MICGKIQAFMGGQLKALLHTRKEQTKYLVHSLAYHFQFPSLRLDNKLPLWLCGRYIGVNVLISAEHSLLLHINQPDQINRVHLR